MLMLGQLLLRYVLHMVGEVFFLENDARKPQQPGEDPLSLLWLQGKPGEHWTQVRVSAASHLWSDTWATDTPNAPR